MRYDAHIPRGLEVKDFRSKTSGRCSNCINADIYGEPLTDPRAPRAQFCSPGCLNDFLHIRMGLPREAR